VLSLSLHFWLPNFFHLPRSGLCKQDPQLDVSLPTSFSIKNSLLENDMGAGNFDIARIATDALATDIPKTPDNWAHYC
jgi:hypothetical protein